MGEIVPGLMSLSVQFTINLLGEKLSSLITYGVKKALDPVSGDIDSVHGTTIYLLCDFGQVT